MARETTRAVWKIEELLEIIKQLEVEAREASQSVKINEERITKPPVNQHRYPNRSVQNADCGRPGTKCRLGYNQSGYEPLNLENGSFLKQ